MKVSRDQHRALGTTGLVVPPIVFGAAALGNVGRVITEQTKLAICGEWFRQVAPPVIIDVAYEYGDGAALEVLGRILRRLEVANDEVIIQLTISGIRESAVASSSNVQRVAECWEKSCRLLGDDYRPKLISIRGGNDSAWQAASGLKAANLVQGIGVETSDFRAMEDRATIFGADWVTMGDGFTVMRHSPEMLAFMVELCDRKIPIVAAGVFEGGFLVGGNRLDGRAVNIEDPANRSLLAWRKAFVALCDGHGITPAHACIQFALSGPGIVAVRLESSYPDGVAENVAAICQKVPLNFWQSMKEEGLLADDYAVVGI